MDTRGVVVVDVLRCGHEVHGVNAEAVECPKTATCTGPNAPPVVDCQASGTAEVAPAFMRVACGYRQRIDYASAGTADVDNGDLFKTARVVVRR